MPSASSPPQPLRPHHAWLWLSVLALALIVSVFFGLAVGSTSAGLSFTSPDLTLTADQRSTIIWDVRAPRVLLAAIVGAGLAAAGAVMQAIVRNVLADPYILGVHSGASCGAAAAILFGAGAALGDLSDFGLQICAFLGALGSALLVFAIASSGSGALSSTKILLSGIAVGYALSSVTSFLIFASDSPESSRSVMFWLLGSLGLAAWGVPLALCGVVVLSVGVFLIVIAPRIDALSAGDSAASSVGINPHRLRLALLIVMCLLVGVMVAMSGAIGFVGLIVPHVARRLVGARHRWVAPMSMLVGAVLLIWADIAARTVLAPQELPIGIVTALVGTPFFIVLLRQSKLVT